MKIFVDQPALRDLSKPRNDTNPIDLIFRINYALRKCDAWRLLPSKFRNPSHKIASLRSILKRKRARSRFVHYFTKTKRETKRNGKKGRSRRCHEEGERNLSALFSTAVSRKLIFDSIPQNDGEWRGRRTREKEGDGGKASRLPPSLLLPSPSPSHHPPSMDRPCWIH